MTIAELHQNFKIFLDKNSQSVAFGGCPAFLPEEIDLFLNQAYIDIISNKFTGTNVRKEAFEGSVKRIADLEGLVKTDSAIALTTSSSSNVLTLADFKTSSATVKRMFYVQAILHFGTSNSISVELVDHETARKFRKTYNNDPWINIPVATLQNNTLEIFIDTTTMLSPFTLDLSYVKYPEVIVNTNTTDITEIPTQVLYEIINRAVAIALENIESQRTSSKLEIDNLQE